MLEGARVFLTGGAGFIGTNLARRLVAANEVVVFDNLHRDALSRSGLLSHPRLSFVQGDVTDGASLSAALSGATHVVHLAAIAGVDTVLANPVRTLRVNLLGTLHLLEAAARLPGLARLVDFSTSEIFGARAYNVDETHVTQQGSVGEARWSYAVSKLAGEYLVDAYHHEHGLPTVCVRPFNVYGPGQVGRGAVHEFVVRALRGDDLVVQGDGSQIRAWCYVDDLVEAVLRLLFEPRAVGHAFNIGNPRSVVRVDELARLVIDAAGSGSRVVHRPLSYVDIEVRVPRIDKARALLGWEPAVDLREGLERTIAWYRSVATAS